MSKDRTPARAAITHARGKLSDPDAHPTATAVACPACREMFPAPVADADRRERSASEPIPWEPPPPPPPPEPKAKRAKPKRGCDRCDNGKVLRPNYEGGMDEVPCADCDPAAIRRRHERAATAALPPRARPARPDPA